MAMTPEELDAHVEKELELKAEIEALVARMRNSEYRTKTEKQYFTDELAAKRLELREHLGLS